MDAELKKVKELLIEINNKALAWEDMASEELRNASDGYDDVTDTISELVERTQSHLDQIEQMFREPIQPGLKAACEYCRKTIEAQYTGKVQFCSDECKAKLDKEIQVLCLWCEDPVANGDGPFCSLTCENAYEERRALRGL